MSLSPTNALCVSPIRTAASGTSMALRKKNSRFLLGTSGESERDLGSAPPLHTQSSFSSKHGKRISPKSGGEPAHDAAKTLISAQIERRWTVAFVAYIICLSVLVGVCMERSERQWRSLNAKLDDILARSLDRQCPSFLDLKNIPVELKNIPVELKNILEPDDFESEAVSRTIVIP